MDIFEEITLIRKVMRGEELEGKDARSAAWAIGCAEAAVDCLEEMAAQSKKAALSCRSAYLWILLADYVNFGNIDDRFYRNERIYNAKKILTEKLQEKISSGAYD